MYIIYINIKMKGDADLADTNSKFGLKKINLPTCVEQKQINTKRVENK